MIIEDAKAIIDEKSMVLFTDGSARPNPGNRGWGVHGYLYSTATPKKGSGNPTHYPSAVGYIPKAVKVETVPEITPIEYIDIYSACHENGSNNASELEAVSNAFKKACDYEITKLTIYTDSEYVRKGIYDWTPVWLRNNWIKADGTEVSNHVKWKELLANKLALELKGVEIKVLWVKGHRDNLGNIIADKLAEVGVINAIYGNHKTTEEISEAQGYWKIDVNKHPFVFHKCMYFNTQQEYIIPGEYYLGDHGSDDQLIGKQMSDVTFSVIKLVEVDPMLESVRNITTTLAEDNNSIMMAKLDHLYNPAIYKDLSKFGKAAIIHKDKSRLDLSTLDGEPLAKEIRPARLAMRAVEALSTLKALMGEIESNAGKFTSLDITETIFDKVEGKKGTEYKIKPTLTVGVNFLDTVITHKGVDRPLKLILGTDCPDRNTLKRLEDHKPEIKLISWYESDYVIRYAVYAKTDDATGIWSAWCSNNLFVEP